MIAGLDKYLDHIRADYMSWQKRDRFADPTTLAIRKQMAEDFCSSISFEVGRNYIKVCTGRKGEGRSVHSFVCLRDMGKFTKGDILKAAGWSAPAKNFARGNVMAGNFGTISWAGA